MGATALGRILLVDDQAQNRDMLGRRLERRGYAVIQRKDALTIEEDIVNERVDLVLLDWMMPHRTGQEALVGLRAAFDLEHLPIIVVTALDDGDVVAAALGAGANDYVTKPIDLRVLLARIKVQLDRRAAVLALDDYRNDLERTVHERTRDLMAANANLSAEIHERQAAEAHAQSLARHDVLTGLANRRHFLEELERRISLSYGEDMFALMFIDLDRFKPINDVHGHLIGDQLLQTVAARLRHSIREDSFAARIGGDEFALLVEGEGGRAAIESAARRLSREIAEPIFLNGLKLDVGASIGIALYPNDGVTGAELLQNGDAAMLRAKVVRGECQFFDASIDRSLKSRALLEAELRAAIPAGDIVPYFQPIVHLESGEIDGYEVLARWRHAQRGFIAPSEFIPVAEEAGLVDAMFWGLLARACRDALKAPGEFTLSVNISPSQVRDQWFPEKVLRTAGEAGFPVRRLEIEVTESAMMGDMDRAKTALLSLK
ncbi:MAG: putative bifunctional diguanylate cyclase/phosphodiesterase, partial [Hyphomonadaceae bacterium]